MATKKCLNMPMNFITDRLSSQHRQQLGEVVRFGVVGVVATIIQYAVYWVLIHWINPTVALTVGYVVSFLFNFIATTKFTFRVATNARHGAGFALSHAVNYSMQVALLNLFLWLGVSKQIAMIPVFCVCIPTNFLLVRFFMKKK